jgi:hypothetical protein
LRWFGIVLVCHRFIVVRVGLPHLCVRHSIQGLRPFNCAGLEGWKLGLHPA